MAKILLVEDDKSLREIYGVRLMAEGYDIVSAGDGEEALAMAIKERPDLIVSDVMMPKISGFDMLDILRSTSETKDVKVIMMTALSSDDQRARGEALGADRYLVKSQVGIEDVVRTVHDVLGDSVAAPIAAPSFPPSSAAPAPAMSMSTAQPVVSLETMPAPAPTSAPEPTAPTPEMAPAPTPSFEPAPAPAPALEPAPAPAPVFEPAPAPVAPAYEPTPAPESAPAPAPTPTIQSPVSQPQPVAQPVAQPVEQQAPQPVAQPFSPPAYAPVEAPVEQPAAPAYPDAPAPRTMLNELPLNPVAQAPAAPAAEQLAQPQPFVRPQPLSQPTPYQAPAEPTQAPAPVAAPAQLPQPTAPFSSPAPASLGERVIEPLTSMAPVQSTSDIASQIEQALSGQTAPSNQPPVPPAA